jgi:micrococcal nuclease
MEKKTIIIVILIIISGIIYYNLTGNTITQKQVKIVRIIDGDTLEIENGMKLRLKGINTPEKSTIFYDEAKSFIQFLENSSVIIESYGSDKYGRILAQIYFNNRLINEEILANGLGTLYYYEKDLHYDELLEAEKKARENHIGLWKKSPDQECISFISLVYKEPSGRCSGEERLILQNNCNKKIDLMIKDDATHIYHEIILPNSNLTKNFSCIWNDAGDTVYVWDKEGLLIFYRY